MSNNTVLSFSFPTFLGTGKYKDFTNFLSSEKEYVKLITHILYKMVPEISSKSLTLLNKTNGYHTHPLNKEKTRLALDILRQIVKEVFDYNTNQSEHWINNQGIRMEKLWQISCPGSKGIRLIGFPKDNVFTVLFVDFFHLLEPDKNYNKINYMSNEYSILKQYVNRREEHEI